MLKNAWTFNEPGSQKDARALSKIDSWYTLSN